MLDKASDEMTRGLKESRDALLSELAGAIMLLTAVGLKITPEMADAIISVGIAVAGLVGMLLPDSK